MVISKPTNRSLVSFSLFLLISFVLVAMSGITVYNDSSPPWYSYLVLSSLGPISLFIFFRLIFGYKVIHLGNNQIEVLRPVFGGKKKYDIGQVRYWTESKVKTGKTTTYKELEIKFKDGKKIQLGEQEYSNYKSMVEYLKKKLNKMER